MTSDKNRGLLHFAIVRAQLNGGMEDGLPSSRRRQKVRQHLGGRRTYGASYCYFSTYCTVTCQPTRPSNGLSTAANLAI